MNINKNTFLILPVILILVLININRVSYCAGGKQAMDKTNNIIDLVDRFKLQETDKIVIETNKKIQESPYIKKIILDKTNIVDFLNSLRNNININDFIKTFPNYNVTFYQDDKETFKFGINDWEGCNFIRVYSEEIGSDLLPDKNLYKVLHRMIESAE